MGRIVVGHGSSCDHHRGLGSQLRAPTGPSNAEVLKIGVLAASYIVLMVTTIDWHGYWADEFHTINATALPYHTLLIERAMSGHPPLYFIVEKMFITIAGHTEASYRGVAAVCGLGSLLLTYRIARLIANENAGIIGALVLMCSGTQLLICQIARSYALLQLLMTANALLIIGSATITRGRLLTSAVLCGAACFTHGAAMIAIPAQLLAAAIAMPSKLKLVFSGIAGCLLYVPWWLAFPQIRDPSAHMTWIPPASLQSVLVFPSMLQVGREIRSVPLIVRASVSCFAVGCAILVAKTCSGGRFMLLTWLFTWASCGIAACAGIGIVWIERYFAPALVCQCVVMAAAVSAVLNRRWLIGSFAGATMSAMAFTSAYLYFIVPPFAPWREMAKIVGTHRTSEEAVFVASEEVYATPFRHYFAGDARFIPDGLIPFHKSDKGVWVCFREFDEGTIVRTVTESVRGQFPRMTVYRLGRGVVVHLEALSPVYDLESQPN